MSTERARPAYRRLSPLTPVVRGPLVLLAAVGVSWQQLLSEKDRSEVVVVLLALLVAGVTYGAASWLRTRYWIDHEELRIDTGVVVRRSRRIRIDRLQGIEVVQPLVARVLGLAELRLDVASGAEREGSLAFLPHTEAVALRRTLLGRRDDLREGLAARSPGAPTESSERLLARLRLRRLLVSLVLSTESLAFGAFSVATMVLLVTTGRAALAGVVLPAALGLLLTVGRRFTAYHGFELTETPGALQVRRGLTAVATQTIDPARVQGLLLVEPWLWRPLGWARLEVSVAGYRSTDADRVEGSSTLVPVAPREEVLAVVQHLLRHRDLGAVPLRPPPRRARWRAPVTARTASFVLDGRVVASRRGLLTRRLDVVPRERVQSVRLSQGPLGRALRLARVDVDSPPGPVRVEGRLRDVEEGRSLVRSLLRPPGTEA